MKKIITVVSMLLFSAIASYGQSGTITFSGALGYVFGPDHIASDGEGGSADIPGITMQIYGIDNIGTLLGGGTMAFHDASDGYSVDLVTWDDGANTGSYGLTIKSSDGTNFKLSSVNFQDWGNWSGSTYAIDAYDEGLLLGTATFTGNTTSAYVALTRSGNLTQIFDNVDEVRIHSLDGSDSWIGINDIAIAPAITAPSTQTSSLVVASNAQGTQLNISWTSGNGASRAVFLKQGTGAVTNPTNGSTYTASTNWSSKGTQLGSSGYYCIYTGSGSSVSVTNIAANTQYTVCAFDYNGSTGGQMYYTATATGNPTTQTSLPVELTSFTASSTRGLVTLHWETATEVNNFGFDIEKAARTDHAASACWTSTGFVEGKGTTNSPTAYAFTDKCDAAGTILYRLKQIDRDGRFEYSKVVEVTAAGTPTTATLLQNYPNPFNPSTTISFRVPVTGHATLTIFNALGQPVATLFDGIASAGIINTVAFNASDFASGMYFSRLEHMGKSEMNKMTLMK